MTIAERITTTTPRKARVAGWDNARWLAITLVVIGHAITKLIADSDSAYTLYLFIYLFHVPVFVTVAGYFAKAQPPGYRGLKRLFTDIVFPYIVFETVWSLINWAVTGKLSLDYTTASWTLWFLIALGIWRASLPYLVMLRYPLLFALLISVAAGYLDSVGSTLALSRTAGLLPFFVFGWKLRHWDFTKRWFRLRSAVVWRWRAGSIALFTLVLVVLGAGIGTWRELLIRRFLLYDEQYDSFGYDQWWAGAVRLGMIALGATLTLAFLTLVPRRRVVFTAWGAATLYIYLLHSFFLYPLRESGVLAHQTSPWVLAGVIVLAIAISVFLSQPFIKKAFHWVIEPDYPWLFRRQALKEVPPATVPDVPVPEGTLLVPAESAPAGSGPAESALSGSGPAESTPAESVPEESGAAVSEPPMSEPPARDAKAAPGGPLAESEPPVGREPGHPESVK
ncbi:acyltransferase family protein [Humibacter albus]|jgi:fucose 4-O-acetylase-like acetyltransferase|uniref:acyltransferase family protein n=1 Tax=Humibacter albus TaxID=427754 RepID=UPI0003B45469|nr:acyltransferase family protein [Humibacter albus]